jgi:hypothetical protein
MRWRNSVEEAEEWRVSRVFNQYADFRESLQLLLWAIHCSVEIKETAAGGFTLLFSNAAA